MDRHSNKSKTAGRLGQKRGNSLTSQVPGRANNPQNYTNPPDENSDDWNIIEYNTQSPTSAGVPPTPSYNFPGTWDAAYHSTSHALREVTTASSSYITSLSNSGIQQAGWSIGTALASTANKSALSLAGWVADASGADTNTLPSGVKTWLKCKEKLDKARQEAKDAEEKRLARRRRRNLLEHGEPSRGRALQREPRTFADERGAFVLDVHDDERSFLEAQSSQRSLESEKSDGRKVLSADVDDIELDDWHNAREDIRDRQTTSARSITASARRTEPAKRRHDGFMEQTLTSVISTSPEGQSKLRGSWAPEPSVDARLYAFSHRNSIPPAEMEKEDGQDSQEETEALLEDEETVDIFAVDD